MRLWDAATGRLLRTLEGHSDEVRALVYSPDGRTLASCGGELKLWDPATGALRRTLKWGVPVNAAAFSPDGKTLATGSADHTARLWDPETGLLLRSLKEHRCSRVTWVAFSLTGPAQFIPLGFYSESLWIFVGIYQLVFTIIAAIVGAAPYGEKPASHA